MQMTVGKLADYLAATAKVFHLHRGRSGIQT